MIYSLSYHSQNRLDDITDDTRGAILSLLEAARTRNGRLGITGALMFNEGRFAQVLEGSREAVTEVFQSIKNDRRHSDIAVVSTRNATLRTYGTWSMAFVGSSDKAKAYYEDVVNTGRFDWSTASGPSLDRLLLDLIKLD